MHLRHTSPMINMTITFLAIIFAAFFGRAEVLTFLVFLEIFVLSQIVNFKKNILFGFLLGATISLILKDLNFELCALDYNILGICRWPIWMMMLFGFMGMLVADIVDKVKKIERSLELEKNREKKKQKQKKASEYPLELSSSFLRSQR